jgi:Fic family protein
VNIDSEKANIGEEKVNIEDVFTAKTASNVRKLQEALGTEPVFGRSDVERVLGLKPTRCTALLREMAEHGIIEPVPGHGKGKYRFREG